MKKFYHCTDLFSFSTWSSVLLSSTLLLILADASMTWPPEPDMLLMYAK